MFERVQHQHATTPEPARADPPLVRRRADRPAGLPPIRRTSAGGNVIRRAVVPKKSPESTADDATLKQQYNAAWDELWPSDDARHIYQFVHELKRDTTIEVGAENSDAEPGRVRWNPSEKNVLLNRTQAEIGVGTEAGGKIQPADIVGQSSAAVTLIHELGHVRQHHDANLVIEKIKARFESLQTTKVANLAELVSLVDDQATGVSKAIARGDARMIIEDDNVTRHERPVANKLGEARRNEYNTGMGNDDQYAQHFTKEAWELVKKVEAMGSSWKNPDASVPLGTEQTRTAVGHMDQQLTAMREAASKIKGWRKAEADKAVTVVETIVSELKKMDVEWSQWAEPKDLTKPQW